MTAIGFAMFCIGAICAWLIDDEHDGFMAFAAFLSLAGLGIVSMGITTWLWRVMP